MTMKSKVAPVFWSVLIMAAALALTLYVAVQEKSYFTSINLPSQNIQLAPVILYFLGAVAVIALALFLVPLKWLRYVFKILFALMFAWGIGWVILMPFPTLTIVAYSLGIIASIVWIFWARIWLHDFLLLIALAAAGSLFGYEFSPWTFMIFMLIIAVYDVLAVRFGLMVWMADRMSRSTTLPAFILPKQLKDMRLKMETVQFGELKDKPAEQREHAVLGGGDIGFPLMLAVSVFFQSHLASGIVVGVFALAGLIGAFLIQMLWLKGKPMPALPPIAFMSLVGFLITMHWMN
jgi:presenilin-like A22 family membrane protease